MESSAGYGPKITLNQNIWLISFGDLLTLVLCFFISIISLSPLNPERKLQIQNGTPIALNKTEIKAEKEKPRFISLDLYDSDLAWPEYRLSETAVEKVRDQVLSGSYSYQKLKLETCTRLNESDISGKSDNALRLLDNLRRQVFGAGVKAETTLLSPLATACGENVAARIILNFEL